MLNCTGGKNSSGGGHRTDWITTYPFSTILKDAKGFTGHPVSKGGVVIGHDIWIGMDAVILSGVKIGNGAVIAARSVVNKDIPPYAIVAGNPGRLVKCRFDQATIADLQEIAWWNWPVSKIKDAWPLLLSSDIKLFIERYKNKC